MREAIPTTSSTSISNPSLSKSPQPSSPTIRLATAADAAQIAHLGATVFTTTFGYSLPPADLATYLEDAYSVSAILADLSNPSITTFVAVSPSHPSILGFTQINRSSHEPCLDPSTMPKPVELQRIYVSTAAHGMGLGKKLVQMIEERARAEGYETLWLGVWEENSKAQGFYGKLGFVKCGTHDFTMGSCVQADWIMWKAL